MGIMFELRGGRRCKSERTVGRLLSHIEFGTDDGGTGKRRP